jgi:dTDP-D-glucose 4,6-dehydratase
MKVLLTGAAGFVGAHALEHILETTDWDVVCLDSFRHKGKADRIRVVLGQNEEYLKRVKVIRHDLTTPIYEQTALEIGKVDYVLNIASESHVDRSIDEPRTFIENNVLLVLTMLE